MAREVSVWYVGGADIDLRIPLLRRVRAAGFDVSAVGTSEPNAFESEGIRFFSYGLVPGIGPVADLRARRQLTRLFREFRPDIVHCFDTKPSMIVPLAARSCEGTRCVSTITGMGRLFSNDSVVSKALRSVYRYVVKRVANDVSITVFQNDDDERYFIERGLLRNGRHTVVRGSGVDVGQLMESVPSASAVEDLREQAGVDEPFMVLMVARLIASKGVREFLEAARVVKESIGASFVLVGPADAAESSGRALLREVEANPNVIYLGPRDDVPALLAAADLFVLPTYLREGLPRVLLEAAVMGVPIVSTGVAGCKEIVQDGATGLVVEPRDVGGLAAAIGRLLSDASLRRDLAAAARDRVVSGFSLDRVAREYVEIYGSVL